MKYIGTREVGVRKLVLPDDTPKRRTSPNVKAIAQSLKDLGVILNAPTVVLREDGMYEVVAGRDRITALVAVAQKDKVLVNVVEAEDEYDIELATLIENTHRRIDPDKNSADLERVVAIQAARVARRVQDGTATPAEAKAPRRTTIAMVAKERGVTPAAVKKQLSRSRKKAQEMVLKSETTVAPQEADARIESFGLQLGREWMTQVIEVQHDLERAVVHVTTAQGLLTKINTRIEDGRVSYPAAQLQKLRELTVELAQALKGAVPRSLCPYCKGQEEFQENCAPCVGEGYIREDQLATVPEELKSPNTVWVRGKVELLNAPPVPDFLAELEE